MRKITADYIYTGKTTKPLLEKVISLDEKGRIIAIDSLAGHPRGEVDHFKGALCPGFINAHCHLELSHLKDQIPTGTKLIPFITDIVTKRDFPASIVQEHIEEADRYMWNAGIQAVGDICNTQDSFTTKSVSPIYYHSFIELFDLYQKSNAQASMDQGIELLHTAGQLNLNSSLTAHAPYSVSPQLLKLIVENNSEQRLSIHNQETAPEDELFLYKEGDFLSFYQHFNLALEDFKSTGKTSLNSIINQLNPSTPTLLVHNSFTTKKDILQAEKYFNQVFWCTCPNANLYIENRLPSYEFFLEEKCKMVIGTDSLSSNWQLSILEEMKTLRKYRSSLSTGLLLTWACDNGSVALGVENRLGSIAIGKSPGILHLTTDEEGELFPDSTVKRLV